MPYLIITLILLVAVLAAVALSRRQPVRQVPRAIPCGLALVAAGIAGMTASLVASDRSIEFTPAVWLLAADAICALGVVALTATLRPGIAGTVATFVALVWLALGLAVLPFALATSACACTSGVGPNFVAPTIAGLDARDWIPLADMAGPILLAVAAFFTLSGATSPTTPAPGSLPF